MLCPYVYLHSSPQSAATIINFTLPKGILFQTRDTKKSRKYISTLTWNIRGVDALEKLKLLNICASGLYLFAYPCTITVLAVPWKITCVAIKIQIQRLYVKVINFVRRILASTNLFTDQQNSFALFGYDINQEIRSYVINVGYQNWEIIRNRIFWIFIFGNLKRQITTVSNCTAKLHKMQDTMDYILFIFEWLTLFRQCSQSPEGLTTYSNIVSSPSTGGKGRLLSCPFRKFSNLK